MYAVICSPQYWSDIQQAIINMGEEILLKVIDTDIDINSELTKVARISIKHLIIDITTIHNHKKFIHSLMQYKIMNDKTQIIIIAPGCIPGNELIHKLVTQVHVYDIIAPSLDISDSYDMTNKIQECITSPGTYKKGVKWVIDDNLLNATDEISTTKEKLIERETERIIIRKQLVGKVVIGLAGTHSRVGTTHLGLSLVNFLRRRGFSVAFLQLDNSNHVEKFINIYDDSLFKDGFYSLKGVDYYLYDQDFNINVPFKRNYDFFVLDVGVYDINNLFVDEYERANVKGIVTTAREWEIQFLETFLTSTENDQYDYLINYADEKLFDYIVGNMNAGSIQYNIFNMNMESDLIDGVGLDEVFEQWLKRFVSTQAKNNEKTSFFGKLLKKKL